MTDAEMLFGAAKPMIARSIGEAVRFIFSPNILTMLLDGNRENYQRELREAQEKGDKAERDFLEHGTIEEAEAWGRIISSANDEEAGL